MEDEREEPFFERARVDRFLKEKKTLKKKTLRLKAGNTAVHIPLESREVPDAKLTVHVLPDGDVRIGVGIPERPSVTFCRYDRSPHARPRACSESGDLITDGHKHYYGRNVKGEQRVVKRGPKDIPTSSPSKAIRAFCVEVGIEPPTKISVILPSGLGGFGDA